MREYPAAGPLQGQGARRQSEVDRHPGRPGSPHTTGVQAPPAPPTPEGRPPHLPLLESVTNEERILRDAPLREGCAEESEVVSGPPHTLRPRTYPFSVFSAFRYRWSNVQ